MDVMELLKIIEEGEGNYIEFKNQQRILRKMCTIQYALFQIEMVDMSY